MSDMKCARILYSNGMEFAAIAQALELMTDFKVSRRSTQAMRLRTQMNVLPSGL